VDIDALARGPGGRSGQQRDPEPGPDQLADAGRAVCLERDAGLEARGGGRVQRVDPDVPVADTVGAMAGLVAEGKVRHLGLSEATPAQLEQAAAVHPVSAVEFEWSLLWRDPEDDVVPAARRLGIGLVPYSPLGRGLLTATLARGDIDTSDFRRPDPRFHGPGLDRNLQQVVVLRDLADGLGLTPGQLALAWLLAQGPDVVPIPGSRRPDRIAENAAAAGARLSPDDVERLGRALPRSAWAGDRHSFAVPVTARGSGGQIPQAAATAVAAATRLPAAGMLARSKQVT